ncbi:hypothetical protein DFAR_2180006 [Desulfarculales bacterium]
MSLPPAPPEGPLGDQAFLIAFKQNLKVKIFVDTSSNALKIQV